MTPTNDEDPSDAHPPPTGRRATGMTATWVDLSTTIELPAGARSPLDRTRPDVASSSIVALDQFLRDLISSDLLSSEVVRAIRERLEAREPDPTHLSAEDLARELVREGRLTPYQAGALLQGKTRGLSIGNYLVLDKIGAGGMGLVFKAWHRRLKRVVALKVLPPSFTGNPAAVVRFHREAEAAAHLAHPNIVAAIDADEYKGLHFFVMEFVDGRDLAHVVRDEGPLPLAQAIDCAVQAARGLQEAHSRQIFHRDIKPSNLLLEASGRVKVSDLGLARLASARDELGTPGAGGDLTRDGAMMGTVDFMPPEQAYNSRLADQRSDIYSLGCTLYYLVTGQVPYPAETLMARLLAHREAPFPSVRDLRPEASPAFDLLLRKMTAKAPEARYASVEALLADLEALPDRDSSNGPAAAVPAATTNDREANADATVAFDRSPRDVDSARAPNAASRRLPPLSQRVILVATAGLVLSMLALIVDSRRIRTGELVIRTGGHDVLLSILQDGRPIIPTTDRRFFELNPGNYELELVKPPPGLSLDTPEVRVERGQRIVVRIVEHVVGAAEPPGPPSGDAGPTSPPSLPTSPTSPVSTPPIANSVSFPDRPGLVRSFEHGGGSVWAVAFAQDGQLALSSGQDGHLRSWDLSRGTALRAVALESPAYAIAVEPDGRLVVTGGTDGTLRLYDPETGRRLGVLTGHTRKVNSLAIASGGHAILSGSDDATMRLWDARSLQPRGLLQHDGPVMAVAFARAGQLALALGRDVGLRASQVTKLDEPTRLDARGVFLSLATISARAGAAEGVAGRAIAGTESGLLSIWDLDRNTSRTLEGGPIDWINSLAPLPDGRHLVAAYQGGKLLLWNLSEGRVVATLTESGAGHLAVAVSPDGQLALSGDDDGRVRVWKLPPLSDHASGSARNQP